MTSESAPAAGGDIIARAASYYRNTRYLMVVILIGMGAWFAVDGFYRWPHWPETHPAEKPKTETDILLQKVLGCALPPLGIVTLLWALRNSRGEYRLSGDTLSVPGHPPVPLDAIQAIDKKLWDRKGIAYLEYELSGGAKGQIKLDDFVYEREPTDQIFKRVEASVTGHTGQDAQASPAA